MPTIDDVIVRKPTEEEDKLCREWAIWRFRVSEFEWAYTEKETCLIVEGKVTVTDGKDSVSFGPGDMVIFPDGLECTWQVTEAVTKHYSFG